jgi:hypothetical protein
MLRQKRHSNDQGTRAPGKRSCRLASRREKLTLLLAVSVAGLSLGVVTTLRAQSPQCCYPELNCCGYCRTSNYCYIYPQCCSGPQCTAPSCSNGDCSSQAGCTYSCGGTISSYTYSCAPGYGPSNGASGPQTTAGPRTTLASYRPGSGAMRSPAAPDQPSPGQGQEESPGGHLVLRVEPGAGVALVKGEGPIGDPVPHFGYTLRNQGTEAIVALAIRWRVYMGQQTSPSYSTLSKVDYWLQGPRGWFAPNESRSFTLPGSVSGQGAFANRYDGKLVDVEFADGTRMGTECDAIHSQFTSVRKSVVDEYQLALAAYRRSGKAGLALQLIQTRRAPANGQPDYRLAAGMVQNEIQRKGFDAALNDLERVAAMSVP